MLLVHSDLAESPRQAWLGFGCVYVLLCLYGSKTDGLRKHLFMEDNMFVWIQWIYHFNVAPFEITCVHFHKCQMSYSPPPPPPKHKSKYHTKIYIKRNLRRCSWGLLRWKSLLENCMQVFGTRTQSAHILLWSICWSADLSIIKKDCAPTLPFASGHTKSSSSLYPTCSQSQFVAVNSAVSIN